MLSIDENKICFQCDIYKKQVVHFKSEDTRKQETICESCLDAYIAAIHSIVDTATAGIIKKLSKTIL